ncbi:MucBP domain-containing protein, partial [Streptococcus suis]
GTVVIEYVDTKGNPIKTSVVDDKDVPVGTDYDTTDEDGKPSTITVGKDKYVLVPSLTQGTENGKVVEGTTTITYVYQKVANWIPELPGVPDKDRPRTPYPFNPEQPANPIPGIPTNPETGIPVIPHVDGYVPNVPGTTDPLKPVDPKDPSKGYIPPSPENVEEDTRIPYTPVKRGTVIVHYEDTAGNVLKTPVTDENNVPVGTDYNTTDEGDKPTKLTHDGENYVLVPSKTRGTEEGKVVEGTTEVTYVYQKVANWIPLIPGEPNPPKTPYPFDPTKPEDPIPTDPKVPGVPVIPYVPGYEPEIPLTPVDPEDPTKGYIPP